MENLKPFDEGKRLFALENRLAESLKPVFPNQHFVNSLKEKLAKGSTTVLETSRNHSAIWILGLGLSLGLLLVWFFHKGKQ